MIKDRITLGLIAGFGGNLFKTAIDEISHKKKISQQSFRETAAGVWVSTKKEAKSTRGQILGAILDFGAAGIGGITTVYMLSKTGRDQLTVKGITMGVTTGALISAALSTLPQNKVRPKDAASNLSYIVSHVGYGLVTTYLAAKLGDASLFDVKPNNDYLMPTTQTSEEKSRPYYFGEPKGGSSKRWMEKRHQGYKLQET
ncbi:MAG: hypothetical protein ACYC2T_07545 [Bacillota bacterium]